MKRVTLIVLGVALLGGLLAFSPAIGAASGALVTIPGFAAADGASVAEVGISPPRSPVSAIACCGINERPRPTSRHGTRPA